MGRFNIYTTLLFNVLVGDDVVSQFISFLGGGLSLLDKRQLILQPEIFQDRIAPFTDK